MELPLLLAPHPMSSTRSDGGIYWGGWMCSGRLGSRAICNSFKWYRVLIGQVIRRTSAVLELEPDSRLRSPEIIAEVLCTRVVALKVRRTRARAM